MSDRRFAGWVARDLEAHVDELAAASRRWREGASASERTVVTVQLASGARLTGYVLDRVRGTLVLQGLPQRGSMDVDVSAIAIARIEALTLHAAQDLVSAETVPGDVAQTSLELKRRARALGDMLASRASAQITVEIESGDVEQVAPMFELVRAALEKVCADEIGRGALAERVQRVVIRSGATPRVSLAGGTLVVEGTLASGRLQSEIDALL